MKVFSSKWFFCLLAVILLLMAWLLYKQLIAKNYLQTKLNNLEAKVSSLDKENKLLEQEAEGLDDPDRLEEASRRLYVLKKPGEQAMVMPEELLVPSPTPETVSEQSFFGAFWQKIKTFFSF
ncbi:MAG TPA: septum formation initiator family protein [Candidatus Paceibacterota bacterium]|nr:septum formation initiator family protein [Candidatus Paceibacterota bacterium]